MFLKKYLLPLALVFFLIILVAIHFTQKPVGKVITVILKETGFEPQAVAIKQGDSIVFKTDTGKQFWPASDLHPTHGIYPEFDPQEPIEPQDSWQFKFDKRGSWHFHDHLEPFFRGVINVE